MELNLFENCNFTLRSLNATSIDANKTDMTWTNIDLRQVLGHIYDMYDIFKIDLVNVTQKNIGTFTDNDNSVVILNMTGLPYENCSYDYTTKTNSNTCVIGYLKFLSGYGFSPNTQNGFLFRKQNGLHTIRINYTRVVDNVAPAGKTYADVAFHFCIYGVK